MCWRFLAAVAWGSVWVRYPAITQRVFTPG
jgi:hypothetical protein